MLTRQQVLNLICQSGAPLELECVCVKYRFHFNCNPQAAIDRTVFEVGRNDVDIPIVVDLGPANRCWNSSSARLPDRRLP